MKADIDTFATHAATWLKLKKPGSNDYGVDFMAMDVLLKI